MLDTAPLNEATILQMEQIPTLIGTDVVGIVAIDSR